MTRLVIVDHSLADVGSHHSGYSSTLASIAIESGWEVVIGTNRRLGSQVLRGIESARIMPVFRNSVYGNSSFLAGLDRNDRWDLERGTSRKKGPGRISLFRGFSDRSMQNRWIRSANRFAADCRLLFGTRTMTPDDIILLATASEVELYGLTSFLAHNPQTILGNWNLLFHFNLFHGRPPSYGQQMDRMRLARERFLEAIRMVPYHHLRFHTTTDSLADQYNRLGVALFSQLEWPVASGFRTTSPTVPVPLSRMKNEAGDRTSLVIADPESAQRSPLRFVMPGTVRREKGQSSYLADVVQQLQKSHLDSGRIQFVVQAPRRPWFQRRKIALGRPVESIDSGCSDPVLSLPHPLPPEDYVRLIDSADVGLLMYDRNAYYARRAGVLSEMLSRGKPVIVSAGTWMGDELEEFRNEKAAALARGPLAKRSLDRASLEFDSRNLPHQGGVVTFDQDIHAIEFSFPLEEGESGFVIQFLWHHPAARGTYCRIQSLGQSAAESLSVVAGHPRQSLMVSAFLRIEPGQKQCRIRMTNAYNDACASIQGISITTLDSRAADLPMGELGLAVYDASELPAAIIEMERHYLQYRKIAEAWTGEWNEQHDGRRTLQRLHSSPVAGAFNRRAA